ncbi:DUF6197 family protein [Sphingomonas japonica]|uniref:Immunity protein Imm6 n=1 Tax=Sphingomonas japonica TaxID=511662 RepID=A0ABX0U638_9SPHN|nr:hypothetical protein [Sphingomonas japonica]NIJ24802.1 hypothetical protein [Sphingomonas japonica]
MSELTVAEVLDRAADLIEPQGAWTQYYYALDAYGRETYYAKEATCFCALGAISVACGAEPSEEEGTGPQKLLWKLIGAVPISEWNDAPERTQAEVVAKLREAAALAREQGA